MSKRQLPADHRSRIRQGFAASLLFTTFFSGFFWLQMSSKGRGQAYIEGGPVAQSEGDRPDWAIGPLGAGAVNSPLAILQKQPCCPFIGR